MKVFISWSGERSKKIAETLKEWIKCVIQSAEPFVSSEDIQKGARWSNDISKELQDSSFGILCVTKGNLKAPWLLFEAGALSKALDKDLVVPFLFELNPSDLQNSPLLQFQAATFSKEEIYKLMSTMNDRIERKTPNLKRTFEKWYPELEESLNEIISSVVDDDDAPAKKQPDISEEILSLSRDNQKLLKSSESRIVDELGRTVEKFERRINEGRMGSRRQRSIYIHYPVKEYIMMKKEEDIVDYDFLTILTLFKKDYPWVYEAGKDLLKLLNSNPSYEEKDKAILEFEHMLDYMISISNNIIETTINGLTFRDTSGRRLSDFLIKYAKTKNTGWID